MESFMWAMMGFIVGVAVCMVISVKIHEAGKSGCLACWIGGK